MRIPAGKLPPELLRELLGDRSSWPAELLLGPAPGEDACAIAVPAGTLVAATDPVTFTGSGVGAHAVWINANDVAVMGVRPRWFLAAVLLPETADEVQVREIFAGMREALDALDARLVGGHTEITPAVRQPLVVGQMLGLAESGRFVSTGGVRPGDSIVQVGAVPIEGAAVLAAERPEALEPAIDRDLLARARGALQDPGISVVQPALAAAELGATALHDPTEGGLAAGLHELAAASDVRLRVDAGAVAWFEPGRAVCAALGADPWATLASGSLLAAFPPERTAAALERLAESARPVRRIGTALAGSGVELTSGEALLLPARDEVARLLSEV